MLALLPGSRLGEVQRLAAPFLRAAAFAGGAPSRARSDRADGGARGAAGSSSAALAAAETQLSVRILDGQARTALTAADAALVASGTATLEALLCRCPMVVAYRVGAVTALLLRALRLVRLPYFALPNLLAGEALAPEFLQEAVQPEPMAQALERLLDDARATRRTCSAAFRAIHESLRQDGAALAAEAVLQLLREKKGRGVQP